MSTRSAFQKYIKSLLYKRNVKSTAPSTHYTNIIIGGGTAGCLLANRLSADPARKVLLIESGKSDAHPALFIPAGYLHCIGNPAMDWMYRLQPEPNLNGRTIRYPRGRVLGGCSAINGMIYMRGQKRDYDAWAKLLDDDQWTWDNCLPYFLKHEDHQHVNMENMHKTMTVAPMHHSGGEWRVERQRFSFPILDDFSKGAMEYGIPWTEDFNTGDNYGVSYFEVNQCGGVRVSAANAFLTKEVMQRPNLHVVVGANVARLLFAQGRSGNDGVLQCTGVEYVPEKATSAQQVHIDPHAGGEVILSAGAINSPVILQRSGVGSRDVVEGTLKHKLVHELPGVGAGLQDHLQIRTIFRVTKRSQCTLNTLSASVLGKLNIGWKYITQRSGPLSLAPSQLGIFTCSRSGRKEMASDLTNIEFHVQPLSLEAFGEPLHPFDALTVSVCNLNPTSEGYVHASSLSVNDPPTIVANYLQTKEDRKVAVESIRVARELTRTAAMESYGLTEYLPGPECTTEEELVAAAGRIATTIFHPASTCRAGRGTDPKAVVDSRLRLHGIAGVRVVDTSVMPFITSGNTCSPTLMVAEKAAHWIRTSS